MDTKTDVDSSGIAPVACTLTNEDAAKQALEWVDKPSRTARFELRPAQNSAKEIDGEMSINKHVSP